MGFGKDKRGVILHHRTGGAALSTLGGNTVIRLSTLDFDKDDFRLMKSECFIALKSLAVSDIIYVGLADASLDVTEIKEFLETAPLEAGDVPDDEKSIRPVWPLCQLVGANDGTNVFRVPNDGLPIVHKKPWTFRSSDAGGITLWAYNPEAAALTDGSYLVAYLQHYGVWLQ